MDATSDVRADEQFRLALFGNPVAHSVSPAMHNAALRALGLDGCYVARCVRHEELPAAVDELRRPPYLGANVTVPHKEAVARLVEMLDGEAAAIGAANTVVREGDRLRGYNTDARGLLSALEATLGVVPYGLRILLLGAGGAARAAAVALLSGGPASLTIYNRHAARAEALAAAMRERYGGRVRAAGPDAAREEAAEADLIVNATSAGLDGVCVPLDRLQTRPGSSLYDMVYTPSPTPLMRLLAAQGANVANGLDMLVFQAAASFTLWTGRAAPLQVMREAALAELQRRGAPASSG
jgi:shikimate dehydrogenase